MARRIDLNADLGEGYGTDEALLGLVTSANIACGFHAGDAATMRAVCILARQLGSGVGAHPSFDDLAGFGRRFIKMSPDELESLVAHQIGSLAAIAAGEDVSLAHVKAHGALYNVAAHDLAHAMAIGRAIRATDPNLIYLGLAGSQMERAAHALGLAFASEAFADRHYDDDGLLLPRTVTNSVITDPGFAAERAVRMIEDGEVLTASGKRLRISFESLCVHGDEPTAIAVSTAVRHAIEAAGVNVCPLSEILGGMTPAGHVRQA